MRPDDEYTPLVRGIGYGLLFHALMCVLAAIVNGILIRNRLKLDTVDSSLHAMLAALASLPFGMLVGSALLFLTAYYPLTGNAERLAQIIVAIGYLTGLILPYFLSFQHFRKQQSHTAK